MIAFLFPKIGLKCLWRRKLPNLLFRLNPKIQAWQGNSREKSSSFKTRSKIMTLTFIRGLYFCRLKKSNLFEKNAIGGRCRGASYYPVSPFSPQPRVWEVSFREKFEKVPKTLKNLTIHRAIVLYIIICVKKFGHSRLWKGDFYICAVH